MLFWHQNLSKLQISYQKSSTLLTQLSPSLWQPALWLHCPPLPPRQRWVCETPCFSCSFLSLEGSNFQLPSEILPGQAKVSYSLPKIPFPITPIRKAVLFFNNTLIIWQWLNFTSFYNFSTHLLYWAVSPLKAGIHLCHDSGLYYSINIFLLDGRMDRIRVLYIQSWHIKPWSTDVSIIKLLAPDKQHHLSSSRPWVLDNPHLNCNVDS